ncbi:hypothetical protein CPB84DRAFT_1771587 [Gymnopilus junonius]|uniref:Uncharacterized protein n=1 Tax=Gymnopilus junonius TaxID=109634 RepID=A0A9P5NVN1_GYMJU|nr:hypothetical protein CPB84DRAFT_1771587 [Gymnopilus junonius]
MNSIYVFVIVLFLVRIHICWQMFFRSLHLVRRPWHSWLNFAITPCFYLYLCDRVSSMGTEQV